MNSMEKDIELKLFIGKCVCQTPEEFRIFLSNNLFIFSREFSVFVDIPEFYKSGLCAPGCSFFSFFELPCSIPDKIIDHLYWLTDKPAIDNIINFFSILIKNTI